MSAPASTCTTPVRSRPTARTIRLKVKLDRDATRAAWRDRARLIAILCSCAAHFAILFTGSRLVYTHYANSAESVPASIIALTATATTDKQQDPLEFTLQYVPEETPIGTPIEADLLTSDSLTPLPLDDPSPEAGAPTRQNEITVAPQPLQNVTDPSDAEPLNLPTGGGLAGRKQSSRGPLVARYGGSPASELAVSRALHWIAAHQRDDGSWSFRHHRGPCAGQCRDEGSERSTTAATALALLPLLGAGNTHQSGEYREQVTRGLHYLLERARETSRGLDLQEGTMYGQGLSTIVLCELLTMTGDEALQEPATEATRYITQAQHIRGGWRYFPGQPGDTTMLGWQWMALRSAQLANIELPSHTISRASEFLDLVAVDDGSRYGYQGREPTPTCTAVGLLCRMYEGWKPSDARITRGTASLADAGPSHDDMYFNYYATQVLHHQRSDAWDNWNTTLRDHLTKSQSTDGHEAGSWYFADPHTTAGGRLCDTALATMILEVYYRQQPLYETDSTYLYSP